MEGKKPKIIIASGPVIVENGEVLLNKHGDTSFYKFCGGRVEDFGLDLMENARREAKEEMGIDIKILDDRPLIMYSRKDGSLDVILVHYLAQRVGEIRPGPDIREWGWFDINNLPADLGPNILPALRYFGFINY
ncbi:MAG: NUDIX domain-containing protein [Candidatus Pacebacteria bacterium]|nr:NUDIX domain-containing protein [Candidatus Paceibacterota bacterium]